MSQLEKSNFGRSGGDGEMARSWNMDMYGYPEQHGPHGQGGGHQSVRESAEWALDLLLRRKWIVLVTCLLVMAGAVLYTYSQSPLYRTSSLVLIDEQRKQTSTSEFSPPDGGSEPFAQSNRSLQNELIILRNSQSLRRGVAERLVQQGAAQYLLNPPSKSGTEQLVSRVKAAAGGLLGSPDETPTGDGRMPASLSGQSSGQSTSPADSASVSVGYVASVLGRYVQFVPADKGTNAIQIVVQNGDPRMAAHLANMYMNEYLELTRKASRAQLSASREFLEAQAEKRKEELQAAERRIQEYKRRNDAMALDQETGSLVSRITQVETQRDEAQVDLRMQRASLETLQNELDSIRPEELSQRVGSGISQEIDALQSEIASLQVSRQQILLNSGPLSPADSAQAAQIQRRIESLQSRVDSLSDKYVDEMMKTGGLSADGGVRRVETLRRQIAEKRIDISGLEARINVLTDRLEEYEAELRSIPEQSMELAQLERERAYAEQMYEYVKNQLQQTRIREESKLGYADGVAQASIPSQPVRPQPRRNLTLALILGLLGGVGLALVRDQLDNRLYKPDRIRSMGYREIGVIPNLVPLIRDDFNGQAVIEHDGKELETSLVSAVKPQSAAAEAYRHVRTNIQFGRMNGQSDKSVQVLLVTSPGAGDGKSVTAANLAISMAQSGRSTLLIDADLRRPRVHKLFSVPQSPGLSEALQNNLQEHVRTPPIQNLSILPAGDRVEHPSELLGSPRLRKLLSLARERFDFVVVDTPPVMAATDAAMLSTQCDAALCVIRAGTTTEPELEHAMETLNDVGAHVLGAVFNGFDVSMAYGYKYRYRNYDRYGPYHEYQSLPPTTA